MSLTIVLACVVLWYLLKGMAVFWGGARRLVERVSPWTRWLHAWVLSAPATFAYIAVFSASTLVQRTAPPRLIDLLTRVESTNIHHLNRTPVLALAESALWVADKGAGLGLYIAVFATVVAWAERRYGTPRIVLICLCGHVFGTLLTVLVETAAIHSGRASTRLAYTTDVGVSYMMVAGVVAAALLMRGWWRAACIAGLLVGVVVPVLVTHTVWDLGHLFATLCGLVAAALSLVVVPERTPPDLLPCLERRAAKGAGVRGGGWSR